MRSTVRNLLCLMHGVLRVSVNILVRKPLVSSVMFEMICIQILLQEGCSHYFGVFANEVP